MTTSHEIFLSIVLLAGIVLAAGCTTSSLAPAHPPGSTIAPVPSVLPVTPIPAIITPLPCPQVNTSTPISINSIPHHYLGDIITFHGTVNLPPGEIIRTGVYSAEFGHCPKSTANCQGNVTRCCGGLIDSVLVIAGTCGINTWSWTVDTSQHGFRADGEYIISARAGNGFGEKTRLFTVSGIPKPNLTLNLPDDDPKEYALHLTGQVNTGNGPEEKLHLAVSSDSGKKASYNVPVYQNGTGYFWNFTLEKSVITPYNFLSVNVSSATSPEIRIERTFLANNEPVYYPYNPVSS